MSRTARRAPLGSRNVNVENQSNNNGVLAGKSASILPSKKDSRSNILQRQQSNNTTASVPGSEVSSTGEGNKAFTSLNSETLRRAISSASVASSNANNNDSTTAEPGTGGVNAKQPLAAAQKSHPNIVRTTPAETKIKSSSSSGEPITIVEHRKRPCGDGYTVHKYLRGKLLGKGGFAKVYKVTSLDTNKDYAVKIVPKANLVKSRARQKVSSLGWHSIAWMYFLFSSRIVRCTPSHVHFSLDSFLNLSSFINHYSFKPKSRSIEQ